MDTRLELMNKFMKISSGTTSCPHLPPTVLAISPKPLIHDDASILSKTNFRQLRDPSPPASPLLHPRVAEAYWTEHGGRSFIPTARASVGLCNQELDLLGCWKPQWSTTYVRTVHRRVSTAQEYVRQEAESGTASNALDEEADVINIMAWVREARISDDQAQAQADRLKIKSIPSGTASDTCELHLRGLRHQRCQHTSAEKFWFGGRRGSVGDGAGASGSGGQEGAGPDSDG